MSIEYISSEHIKIEDGKTIDRVEFAFSEMSELDSLTQIGNGSIGWHKKTGDFYAYDDGKWYAQDGSGEV